MILALLPGVKGVGKARTLAPAARPVRPAPVQPPLLDAVHEVELGHGRLDPPDAAPRHSRG